MLRKVKNAIKWALAHLPESNYIVFESAPVFADNSRVVFEEMIRRGYHKKYRFIWVTDSPDDLKRKVEHVKFILYPADGILSRIRQTWIFYTAKAFISCNTALPWIRRNQYAICLMHGAPLKSVVGHYSLPEEIDDIVSFSEYLMPYEAKNTGTDINKMRLLGFPRNDVLLHSSLDVHGLFSDVKFNKLIYWLPTFRQHRNGRLDLSTVAMPIIYNEEIAQQINKCAEENEVLVVIKPHFAQDVSRIKTMNLSHLRFIDDQFLEERGIVNYALLGKADALLTDYSSVYYDYLLTDHPIGLCWDDYEVFKKREGFIIDMDAVLAGGEKLYNAADLCAFVERIAKGIDALNEERRSVLNLIHGYHDARSTERVVNFIEQKIKIKG